MTPTAKRYKKQAMKAERVVSQMRRDEARHIAKRKQSWSAITYCGNCMEVNLILIPPQNTEVKYLNCVVCGVKEYQYLVRKINCSRTQ